MSLDLSETNGRTSCMSCHEEGGKDGLEKMKSESEARMGRADLLKLVPRTSQPLYLFICLFILIFLFWYH